MEGVLVSSDVKVSMEGKRVSKLTSPSSSFAPAPALGALALVALVMLAVPVGSGDLVSGGREDEGKAVGGMVNAPKPPKVDPPDGCIGSRGDATDVAESGERARSLNESPNPDAGRGMLSPVR